MARQTPNILCYLPPSNWGKIAARFASVTREEIIQINFLYILKQLFTEVEVASGGYLPSRKAAR